LGVLAPEMELVTLTPLPFDDEMPSTTTLSSVTLFRWEASKPSSVTLGAGRGVEVLDLDVRVLRDVGACRGRKKGSQKDRIGQILGADIAVGHVCHKAARLESDLMRMPFELPPLVPAFEPDGGP
jgi:hypothetical protein